MSDSALVNLLVAAVGAYVLKLWINDYRDHQRGRPNPRALPGATPAPRRAVVAAGLGAALIVGLETAGEAALGLTAQQSRLTLSAALVTLVAAGVEEIIFRGYIVINGRGARWRWIGIVAASLVFALLHPFLWTWSEGGLRWRSDAKAWFSTGAVFVSSLWFYAARFAPGNPQRSLLPCFAAHLTKNLLVLAVKAAQGFLVVGV